MSVQQHFAMQTCCATGIGCSISKKNVALPYAGVSTTIRLAALNTNTKARSSLQSASTQHEWQQTTAYILCCIAACWQLGNVLTHLPSVQFEYATPWLIGQQAECKGDNAPAPPPASAVLVCSFDEVGESRQLHATALVPGRHGCTWLRCTGHGSAAPAAVNARQAPTVAAGLCGEQLFERLRSSILLVLFRRSAMYCASRPPLPMRILVSTTSHYYRLTVCVKVVGNCAAVA